MWTEAFRGTRAVADCFVNAQAVTRGKTEQASKSLMRRPTRPNLGEGCQRPDTPPKRVANERPTGCLHRGSGDGLCAKGSGFDTGSPVGGAHTSTGNPRGPAWAGRVPERFGVPAKLGNAGGEKGPEFGRNVRKGTGIGETGAGLQAPVTVRKLQRALHAKVKGSPACHEERTAGELAEAIQAVAPVAEPEAPGEVGEGRALPGCSTVAAPRSGMPASADGPASRGRRPDLEGRRVHCGKSARWVRGARRGNVIKVETEAPALGRNPSATATPSTLDKRAVPRLYHCLKAAQLITWMVLYNVWYSIKRRQQSSKMQNTDQELS